jgi:putative ABC transport system ATP-binding protein
MPGTTVDMNGVSKWFTGNGSQKVVALDRVSLNVQAGQFITIVGANGSGKSTLLRIASGELKPDAGDMTIGNGSANASVFHLAQDPSAGVFGSLSVHENLSLAAMHHRPRWWRRPEPGRLSASERLADVLDPLRESLAAELSQGQRQLLALAIALHRSANLLLLDEFTASLDPENADQCRAIAEALWRDTGITILSVTHDLPAALEAKGRLLVLKDGRIALDLDEAQRQELNLPTLAEMCGYGARDSVRESVPEASLE